MVGRDVRPGKIIEEIATMRTTALLAALTVMVALAGQSHADEIDWTKVDAALGKTASVQGNVHRYGIPRSDLQVTVDGVTIKPALALGGWLGFEPMVGGALVMGDLVLTENEIEPVMTKLLASGIDVTALHNHLLRANPATYYMHVHGHGDPVTIATAIRAALGESKTPFGPPAAPAPQVTQIDLDTLALDEAIGAKGKVNGGVYQFSVPRKDAITERVTGSTRHGSRHRDQLSANRRRQDGDHRRLRDHSQRGEPPHPRFARKWHRGNGDPQPYA